MKNDFNKGLILTSLGSFWWGFIGVIYFESVSFIGHTELVVHRCIWTAIMLILTTTFLSKWKFFLNEIKHESIPLWFLLITPILVLISIPISFYLYILKPKILDDFKNTNMPLYNFLLNKWYVDEFYEKVFVNPAKKIGSFFWKKGDVGIIDRFGPDGISKLVKIISNKTARLQTGFIYDYAFVMLLGLSILLTYLILK